MPYDKIDELYDALKKDGAVSKSRENFRSKMLAPGKEGYQNRLQLYNALKADGAVESPTYEEFSKRLGMHAVKPQTTATAPQQQKPATQAAPAQQKPTTTPAQAATPAASAAPAQKQQKDQPLTPAQRQAMIDQVQQMRDGVQASLERANNRMDFAKANMGLNVPRVTLGGSNNGVRLGQNSRVVAKKPKFNARTGKMEQTYITESGNEYNNRAAADLEQNAIDEEARQPLGLNMNEQQVSAAQKPVDAVVAALWKEAEAQHAADRKKNAEDVYGGNPWLHGGREMHIVDAATNAYKNEVSHLTRFDLQKMMDNAWGRVGKQMTEQCYQRLQKQYPTATARQLQMSAEQMARALSDNAVYKYAVAKNTPKSTLEFFAKTAADANLLRSITKGLARSEAGTTGDLAAYEQAMSDYGKNHRVAQVGGTVTGMMFDPTTVISGFFGSLAGKAALNVGGRILLGNAAKGVGARLFGNTLTGRVVAGVAGGAGNLGAYEGIKEAESQYLHGGHINPQTGENEGYSAGDVLKSSLHGALLGSVTGTMSPLLGNVTDKMVKATSSTAGKVGIRAGELATSTVAEGTIFSIPEWISGDRDAMDVWTDNMAMMIGFKAQHMVKSAPRVIAGMRPIENPKTMQERNHNRMSFVERLRKQVDASPSDMAFSKEEREELQKYGYGDLAALFTRTPKQSKANAKPESTDGKTMSFDIPEANVEDMGKEWLKQHPEFDGYEAMERLMQDPNVSQSARAKAYYILTGRQLPMGTVTGYTTETDENGNVFVKSVTANGEVVTNRRFADEASAKREQDKIMRQVELNSVDVGERYTEAKADNKVWEAAIDAVAPGADPETVKRNYQAAKEGDKDAIANYGQMVEAIDKFMEENKGMADTERPEAIRSSIEEETGINVDKALKKEPSKRTEEEQAAVEDYLKRLFPDQNGEGERPMSDDEAGASAIYDQSRLLWGKVEQGDADAKAEVDAIAIRMKEAYQLCEDAFGSDAEMRMAEMEKNPWTLFNNPELTEDQQDAVLYYINAKAAMDGVQDASNDAMENKRREVAANVERHTHKDYNLVQPATMKVDDKQVYIVKGNIVPLPDGTGIDVRNSDQSIVVCDAETGEYKFTSPDQIFTLGEAIDPQSELDEAYANIQAEYDAVLGGNGYGSAENGNPMPQYGVNDTFTLRDADGNAVSGEVQGISEDGVEIRTDAPVNGKYVQVVPVEEFEGMVESLHDADGNTVWDRNPVAEGGESVQTSSENVPGTPENVLTEGMDGQQPMTKEQLQQYAKGAFNEAMQGNGGVVLSQEQAEQMQQYNQQMLDQEQQRKEEEANRKPTALERVPIDEKTGEPMFEKADKDTALDALNEVTGGNEANTTAIVNAQVEQAQKALDALKKKQPTKKAPALKGSPMAMLKAQQEADASYNAAMEQYNGQVAQAEETLNAWSRIYALMNERKRAIREQQEAEQRERDRKLHDEAVAQVEEQKRIAAEKAAEQAEVGAHAVNPKIKEKWDGAAKVEGIANAITLADGSTIRGHYVLTEAGAASASHDVNNAFEPTEGFPIDENGESVNDRDYKRDLDAQRIVRDIARNYDSRALQSPVIVSKDGIVLSGNNRTMSGDMAAAQGTDKAYIEHLREFGEMYGFTPEQIDGMKHPRVVFVPDEAMPYDATTFARFNAEQQKKQGKDAQAVKLGKVVPDNVFKSIVGDISRYDRLSDFYADDKAVASAISQLLGAGVINEMQLPEMRTGNALSAAGRELIENTLIGKVFQTSPDAVRQIISTPTLRHAVVMGLNEIAHNRTLAKNGYDLSQELGAAVDLVARAKTEAPDIYKEGMPVSPYGRQAGLFDDEYGDSRVTDATVLLLADVLNSGKPSDLRKMLATYNNEAQAPASGQIDMFSGDVRSKEQLLNDVNEYFRNATPREQQAIVDAAVAERKQRAEANVQAADGTGRNGEEPAEATSEERELDNNGRLEERRAKILSNMGDKYSLSEEHADNGEAFIQNENGSTNLAKIPNEIFDRIGISPIPFKLTETMGWHVYDRHHGEAKLQSVSDAVDFVLSIVNNVDHVRLGRDNSYIFSVESKRNKIGRRAVTIMINSKTGEFMGIKTSGYESIKNLQERPLLWERGADAAPEDVATPTITTIEPQQGDERTSRTKGQSNVSSDSKSNHNSPKVQGNSEKSPANEGEMPLSEKIAEASAGVNTEPTEAQKEAGNYKKGHVQVGTFDITIEQPQGSVRRGTDANGKQWESKMHNTYGYFRGTEGVDGDHIDVFLSNDIDGWNGRQVYVVDQYNPDGTFDEHKVMLGFNDMSEAKSDYLANYEKGWEDGRRITVSATNLEDFEKWIDSSHRKTKPFAEYAGVKKETVANAPAKAETKGYSITPTTYTNKKGKKSDVFLLTFDHDLTADQERAVKEFAKERTGEGRFAPARGWKDRESGGWMFRSEEDARKAAEMVGNEDAVADNQPLTAQELRDAVEQKKPAARKKAPAKKPANKVELSDNSYIPAPDPEVQNHDWSQYKQGDILDYEGYKSQFIHVDRDESGRVTGVIVQHLDEDGNPIPYGREDVPPLMFMLHYKAEKPQYEVSDEEVNGLINDIRDILGIGDDEGDAGLKFRDPDELTAEQRQKLMSVGQRLAMAMVERGNESFGDYASMMVKALGDKVRPWLKAFYGGLEYVPGYDKYALTSYEEVKAFDVENFDKPHKDVLAQADMIVEEGKAQVVADKTNNELKEIRNEQRKETEKQTAADTDAVAAEAETVASETESLAETSNDEQALNRAVDRVDETLDKVNDQLALLGYYEADRVEKDFNEAYGYMRNAEKKAVKDAANLADYLIDDLGLDRYEATHVAADKKGKRKTKPLAVANIAPAGGDITMHLPLAEGRELYMNITLVPSAGKGVVGYEGDNLKVDLIMWRVENPNATGNDRYGQNFYVPEDATYKVLLENVQRAVYKYIPQRTDVVEGEYKVGDKVEYSPDGREWHDAVVAQMNDMGGIRIDTGQAPVMWVNAHPDQLRHKSAPKADVDAVVKQAKDAMAAKLEQVKSHLDNKMLTEQIAQRDKYIDELGERVKNGERIGTFAGTKNVDLQSTLLKCIGERDALEEALDNLPAKPSTENIADNPQSWVGKTFTYNGMRLVCNDVDKGYATFDNKSTFMGMGFDVPTVQGWLKSGKMQVEGAKPIEAKEDIFQKAERIGKEASKKSEVKATIKPTATPATAETTKAPAKKNTSKKKVKPEQKVGDLFADSLFNKEEDNELERNHDAVRTEGLPSDGNRNGRGGSVESDRKIAPQGSGRTDGSRKGESGRTRGEVSQSDRRPDGRLQGLGERKNTRNNHSERGADHAPTSVHSRIEANVKAIELAHELLESGETATPEQMSMLRQFSGWGGLGGALDYRGSDWKIRERNKKIRELLGEEAYEQAVMSANSAYYTPAYVVDTLWDIAKQLGFKGGNILEGSAGIGNILGQMPMDVSGRSDIHAIEIDGTSGGILSLLYPDAKVDIQGFEQTRIPNGSVDLAITNVPFVTGLRVNDTTGDGDLSKKFHNIHDFCIAKNVRKLREGGLGIFISSNGTLDNSKTLRDWVVNEGGSDFIGAFRMNNKTFGGTTVTSDIIVIRKRVNGQKSAQAIDVSTISGERTAEYQEPGARKARQYSMDYNKYFIEHPDHMAGEMRFAFEEGDTFRPTSKGLYPVSGKDQGKMLSDFVKSFAEETGGSVATTESAKPSYVSDASADGKKVGELYMKDGKFVIADTGGYRPLEVNDKKIKGHTKQECFNAYTAIKSALADVMKYQTENEDNAGLKPLIAKLNKAFDNFVNTYGHFNKNNQLAWLRNDVDYPNVFSLETYKEQGDGKGGVVKTYGKADVMKDRVVEKESEPHPENVKDGVVVSMFKNGRIDVPYIAGQLGKSEEAVKREIIDSGLGFEDPATRQVEVSYQYLSGNVREKLRQAEANNENGEYTGNIKALQEVVPMDIPAHLIDFTLGSSWLSPKYYNEYVKDRTDIDVKFTAVGGSWFMDEPYYVSKEKNRAMGVVSEKLNKTIFGHELIKAAIQNKTITVSKTEKHWDGTTETIVDREATAACAAKVDEIRQDFKDWMRQKMQSDAELSARMEKEYNDRFNNYVPMSIPGDFVPEYFGGATHKFKMRPHQGKSIVRGTMQPLLLAHEVGTGKTFTLISTAMEMRRLGTARKPMIVVQNATVGQFAASAKELYPNAKILTLEDNDRNAEGRKNFYAKIKYNDWDMIVVPQSTFEFIPDSDERQMQFVQDKIDEKMLVLEQMREADTSGRDPLTRRAEKELADLQAEMAALSDGISKKRTANNEKKKAVAKQNAAVKAQEMLDRRTDDVEDFDDMGIDALLIDEAHEYKHLGFATAMQRGVKGVDPSYSKKSQGVYLKTQAVLEKNNGRNVIFATGTPISNTAAEIWTFMRYLMPKDTMKEYGIYYFDDFVRNFGNIQQMPEFNTSGKFKEVNRFAGYVNLPELVRIWSGVADTVLTKDQTELVEKIPEMEGGKAQDIYLPQTRALRSVMKYVRKQLDDFDKMSGKEKKENSHIPLTMYGIAQGAAVDARLVEMDAEDDPRSKTNEAVRQTLRSLKETDDYKGTVAIFADHFQNKRSGFNLYEDIKKKLVAQGVPADEIVVMKSGMTIKKKLEIFDKVNHGEVRVILGSTATLGTGVNIQERLHTLIHLDAPNRPMDYTQRNGRILRQGNLHKEWGKPVRVLRFGVEDSLDVTAYQRLKTKGAIADSVMEGDRLMQDSMNNRVLEEEEDVFGDTVAQLSGSEYALLKNNAEKNVRKYESRRKQWEADQTYIHNAKPKLQGQIKAAEQRAEEANAHLLAVQKAFPDGKFSEITVGKQKFGTVDEMADFIKEQNKKVLDAMKAMKDNPSNSAQTNTLTLSLGGYDFVVKTEMWRETNSKGGMLFAEVHRTMTYSCPELGLTDVPVKQSLLRNAVEDITENVITGKDFAERFDIATRSAEHGRSELEQLKSREGKPFEFDKELEEAQRQLEEYTEAMKAEMAEKEKKYAEMDASVEAATDVAIDEEDEDEVEKFREGDEELEYVNEEFNEELQKQIDGTLPEGHIYQMGMPGEILRSTGVPYLPIQLSAKKLQEKATMFGHDFDLSEVRDLVKALQNPLAVFAYGDETKAQNIIVPLQKDGKNFIVGLSLNPVVGGRSLEINSIRNVFPKDNAEWLNWISQGKSLYLDKEKVQTLIDQQRTNLADVEYLDLDSVAKVLEKPQTANGLGRNLQQAMVERVNELSERLNTSVRIIRTDAEVAALPSTRQRRMKGSFNPLTGEVTIVVPNNANMTDVESTFIHEVVGHDGLRVLFPEEEKLNNALDELYNVSKDEIRNTIDRNAQKMYDAEVDRLREKKRKEHEANGEDSNASYYADMAEAHVEASKKREQFRRDATEEYGADLAGRIGESGFEKMSAEEQTFWGKLKAMLQKALQKLLEGLKIPGKKKWSDKEWAFVLHEAYKRKKNGGRPTVFDVADTEVMRRKTGFGETKFSDGKRNEPKPNDVADNGIMFRDGDSVEYNKAMARDTYERRVSRGMYQTQEALQDSMLGLKEAMDAILKAEGKGKTYIEEVAGYENAYLGENRLSSTNQAECAEFARRLFKPMLEEVAKLAKTADKRAELTDYMMAKHGLERNEVMARRAAEKKANEEFGADIRKAERAVNQNPLDQDAIDRLDDLRQQRDDREQELYLENRGKDYSGLTALTGMDNVVDAESEARQMVTDYENGHKTDHLWKTVNAVTGATLLKTYESGLINKATYDDIKGMYTHYIPLRGFDDKTSDEAYAYLADKHSAFNAPMKTAKGRKSKADDPFANMEAMAESAIMQGNRNTLVKQKFLNFALNHPSDLVSVSDLWLRYDDVKDEWMPVNSGDIAGTEKLEEDDSPAEVERKMRDFENAMEQAAKNDPAHFKKQKDAPDIPYRVVESRDLRQHQVLVKRNGKDYLLTINGNPRTAQALNGQTNPDNDVSGAIGAIMHMGEKVNRQLSAFYTTRNPDFVVSNFMRDMMYANTMVWVKESPNYAVRFHKNVAKANPVKMKILLAKLRNGTLDMNDETEKMFHQFIMNGGETGYANIRDIEQRKNDIKRELKKMNGKLPMRKAWGFLGERLDEYNRAVENSARFAAFMTSRQLGRTIDRSIWDAKEISVNFNKKGSGAKFMGANGQTKAGNVAAFTSGLGRSFYVFWNAAIQGTANFGRQAKRHPKKAIAGAATMFLLGALMAYLGGDDGDDDGNKDAYYNLPEYVRRSNVVFRLPGMDKSWISLPLPVEYRAMYGMGELMVSAMSGKVHYTDGELAHAIASQVSQMFPIDFMEGSGGFKPFIPSAVKPVAEVITNESWTGMPIYKDTPFNKDDPEWTKAYKSANKYLVGLSKTLNEASGGDAYTSGKIDINPAQVEYLLNGFFGGMSSTVDKFTKMGETIIGEREYDPRSFLLLNRVVKNGDERTEYRAVNNEYFRIKEGSEALRKRLNHYENDTADGVFDYAEKIAWLNNSPEYRILETYEEYSGDIDDINEELKDSTLRDDERKELEAELNQKKKELVDAVNAIRNGKQQ